MTGSREIRRPTVLRTGLAVLAMALALMAVSAERADAQTFCVAETDASCTGPAYTASQFQAALDAAKISPEPDTILVGPADITTSAEGFSYQDTAASGTLQIIGSDRDVSRITNWDVDTAPDPNQTTVGLNLDAGPGSTISKFGVVMPDNVDGTTDTGISLGQFSDAVDVSVTSDVAFNVRGISSYGGDVTNSVVHLPVTGTDNIGVDEVSRSLTVENSNVFASSAVRHSEPSSMTTISHSRITGRTGASTDGGHLKINDSFFRILPGNNPTGVCLCNFNPGSSNMSADINGTTIVGDGATGTFGITALADNGTESTTLSLSNSVITGVHRALALVAGGNRTVDITAEYSMYDTDPSSVAIVEEVGGIPGVVNYHAGAGILDLVADPGFTNTTANDFSLKPTSPLIDKGDPSAPGAGATDILGATRACNGTPGGVKRRDIGAWEYNDCLDPDTSITAGPDTTTEDPTPSFSAASTKPSSTFRCSFDEAVPAICVSAFDAPDLGPGAHTVSVAAVDTYGNIDPTPATRSYTVIQTIIAPPTCATDPNLCPAPPDKTKPVLKLVGKVSKSTTKANVNISFKSNEAGSSFTCQAGKAKAKKCKSPYKAKLKKGKNTISIVATDKAGNKSKPMVIKVTRD